MKNILKYAIIALLAMVTLSSCQKKYEEDFFLAVDHAQIDFPFSTGHSYIQVYSTGSWTVSFDGETPAWCRVDKTSGNGRGAVRVDVDDNLSGYDRTVVVLVKRDDARKEIVIKQKTVI